jgi:hypothetical protein
VLSANGAERSALIALVRAQARGDAADVGHRLEGCARSAPCRAGVRNSVPGLRRGGAVRVLRLDESTSFTLGDHTGTARIAWNTPSSVARPVVECVTVRRRGNPISGISIALLGVRQLQQTRDRC